MGISIWQLVIVLVIVLLLFGTKRLRGLGSDLGSAIKGFRSAVRDGENENDKKAENSKLENKEGDVIEGEVEKKNKEKV